MSTRGIGNIVTAAVVILSACSSPTRPTGSASRPSSQGSNQDTIQLLDGWTNAPVAGARVQSGEFAAVSGTDGRFSRPGGGGCSAFDVEADGFLTRHTTACLGSVITLWRVESADELAAIKSAAFSGDRLRSLYPMEVGFSDGLRERADVVQAWTRAATRISQLTGGALSNKVGKDVMPIDGDGLIIAESTNPLTCNHLWFKWNAAVAGFCWNTTQYYFVAEVSIPAPLVAREEVAMRALLYASAIGPHDMPGLMNRSHPDDDVSPFEAKTLQMLKLRGGHDVRWPDTDTR